MDIENNSYGYLYSDAEDIGMLDQFTASAVDASGDSLNAQSLEEMTCEEYSAERIADLMEDIQKVIREQVATEKRRQRQKRQQRRRFQR